jgi:hypothetical protein
VINPLDEDIGAFNKALATEIRAFLEKLTDQDNLVRYVNDRVGFIHAQDPPLSSEAEALLLDSNYQRIQAVMSAASAPQRWIVIWIV